MEWRPSDNVAAHMVRRKVVWTKESFDMPPGELPRPAEGMMTVVLPLKSRHRSVIGSMTAVSKVALHGATRLSSIPILDLHPTGSCVPPHSSTKGWDDYAAPWVSSGSFCVELAAFMLASISR
jgi:hypothetical protein